MIKIEKRPAKPPRREVRQGEWFEYLETVKTLKVGESFQFRKVASNHRLALSIAQLWLNGRYVVAKQPDGSFRVGRVA